VVNVVDQAVQWQVALSELGDEAAKSCEAACDTLYAFQILDRSYVSDGRDLLD
jgi:hypothetical protein